VSIALLGLWTTGCGTALNYVRTGRPPHPLHVREPGQVDVFMTSKPSRPFVELGIIESQQEEHSLDSEQDVMLQMREYAGQLGCDGLVIFAGNDATYVSGGLGTTTSRTLKGYRGSCIVYTRAAPATVAPPPLTAASTCIPNSTQLCYGPGGCQGGQRCSEDGHAYTLCDCGTQADSHSDASRSR
jgi:hypothetical protein